MTGLKMVRMDIGSTAGMFIRETLGRVGGVGVSKEE